MKKCSRCSLFKPTTEFWLRPERAGGYRSHCKECGTASSNKWRLENKEHVAAIMKAWRSKNPVSKEIQKARSDKWNAAHPGAAAARAAAWAKANPERHRASAKKSEQKRKSKIVEYHKLWYQKNKERALALKAKWREANKTYVRTWNAEWKRKNKHKVNASTVRRQAQQLKATPKWANEFFIEEAYHLAALRTKVMGFKWHVDHIVPLRSQRVCGLHVEQNLQVIPAFTNESKGNKSWPDMAEN